MKQYVKRLAELAAAGFFAGVGTYLATNDLDLSEAGLRGLFSAGVLAAYGVLVKATGDKDRPTAL